MTIEEFNEKYKDYLGKGHYGLDINNQEVIEYLDDKFQELIKIPGFMYYQIKLKFNKPRVYIDTGEGSNIFHEMEQEIYKILID
jgi:hypothetical protein